jgi:hypothetical protein
MPHIVLL